MMFQIIESEPLLSLEESDSSSGDKQSSTIPAHRVIVSSRCPWFRRALTSGMKESIEKKISLHDCSLTVFTSFLQFLYSGLYKLELVDESPQFLADLLVLADRYEVDDLKKVCEEALIFKVDSDCCFALLVLADQFQVGRLRRTCFEFISQRPALTSDNNLEELPPHLRDEIQSLGAWVKEGLLSGARHKNKSESLRFTYKENEVEEDEEKRLREVEDLTNNMRLSAQMEAEREMENIPLTTDSARLEHCLAALRQVLGPLGEKKYNFLFLIIIHLIVVPEETLIDVSISADCNVDRALNYFLNLN